MCSGDIEAGSIICGNTLVSNDYILSNGPMTTPSIKTNYYNFKDETILLPNNMYIGKSTTPMTIGVLNHIYLGDTSNTHVHFSNMTIKNGIIDQIG